MQHPLRLLGIAAVVCLLAQPAHAVSSNSPPT